MTVFSATDTRTAAKKYCSGLVSIVAVKIVIIGVACCSVLLDGTV